MSASTVVSAVPDKDVPAPPPGFRAGLEGHTAFRTEIAEPDRDGGALRYRGVDIEAIVGNVPFEQVWGCWPTARSSRVSRPPSRTRWPSARATRASTPRPRSRCSGRNGASSR